MSDRERLIALRLALPIVVCCLVACGGGDPAGSWGQWRGSSGMGVSTESDLPVRWGTDESIAWKTAIPRYGNSSPIVHDGKVYLTSAVKRKGEEGRARTVLAFDFATGRKLWETDVVGGPAEKVHRVSTAAAATPATDGERLYVYFGSDLAALDFDGNVLWRQTIDPKYRELSRYGASSSPVLTRDSVVILQDREYASGEDPGWLAAFAKEDGRELWRHEWDDTCCTYSTPLVVDRGGGEELIVALSRWVQGRDARTGEVLWSADYVINQLVSSPLLEGDLLIVSGGAHNIRQSKGFRLQGVGRDTRVEELWYDNRMAPETASPVLHNDLLFSVTNKGVLVCRKPETGEIVWSERLNQRGNHGSLVAGDGKVYVVSPWKQTAVVAAAPEFQLLAENELPDFEDGTAVASPAIAQGALLLRGEKYLYKIVGDSEAEASVAPAVS